jgi:hypothetical protein
MCVDLHDCKLDNQGFTSLPNALLTWNASMDGAGTKSPAKNKAAPVKDAPLLTLSTAKRSPTYTRLTKTCLGTFDHEAKSCYDRIIASLALIASRALGMPEAACHIHGQTIDKKKHFIKTAQGTSDSYYSNENEGPLFGSGQGSGGSPPLWLITWVALSNALSSEMTGMC